MFRNGGNVGETRVRINTCFRTALHRQYNLKEKCEKMSEVFRETLIFKSLYLCNLISWTVNASRLNSQSLKIIVCTFRLQDYKDLKVIV